MDDIKKELESLTRIEKFQIIIKFMEYELRGSDFIFPKEMQHLYIPSNIYELESGSYNFDCDITGVNFDTSWDWLMFVIKKVQTIRFCFGYTLFCEEPFDKILDSFWKGEVKQAFEGCVEIINWANEFYKNENEIQFIQDVKK